jgi:hypothetical protein
MLPKSQLHELHGRTEKEMGENLLFNILGVAERFKLAVEMKTVALFSILQSADTAVDVIINAN